MKKLVAIAAVVLMMTGSVSAKNPGLEIRVKEKKVLVVEVDRIENDSYLFLKDLSGEILFESDIINGKYATALDFTVIPVGTYYLSFENENYLKTSVIVKTRSGIEVRGEPVVAFKPYFRVENRSVQVFLTNPKSVTYLKVYDAEGNLVAKEKERNYTFTRTLDFSFMPPGEYTISLRAGDHEFQHRVSL